MGKSSLPLNQIQRTGGLPVPGISRRPTPYLSDDDIRDIVDIIFNTDLDKKRDIFLLGINKGFLDTRLRKNPEHEPLDQIREDLYTLRDTDYLEAFEVPLLIWLNHLKEQLERSGYANMLVVIQTYCDHVAGESQGRIQKASKETTQQSMEIPAISQAAPSVGVARKNYMERVESLQEELEFVLDVSFYLMERYTTLSLLSKNLGDLDEGPEKISDRSFWKSGKDLANELLVNHHYDDPSENFLIAGAKMDFSEIKRFNSEIEEKVMKPFNELHIVWGIRPPKAEQDVDNVLGSLFVINNDIGVLLPLAAKLKDDFYKQAPKIVDNIKKIVQEIDGLLATSENRSMEQRGGAAAVLQYQSSGGQPQQSSQTLRKKGLHPTIK